jgi:hypothetical protein
MTEASSYLQLRKTARTAGFWYLALAVVGAFCLIYIPAKIMVKGNVEATIANILANETLFRIGILGSLVSQIPFIVTALYLYRLFKDVEVRYARLMVAIVLTSVPLAFFSGLIDVAALMCAKGPDYLGTFSQPQLHAMAFFFIKLNQECSFFGGFISGLWLLPLGVLVFKSKFIPKILGILLLLNGVCYVVDSTFGLLLPDSHELVQKVLMAPLIVGELTFMLWLAIIGVRRTANQPH